MKLRIDNVEIKEACITISQLNDYEIIIESEKYDSLKIITKRDLNDIYLPDMDTLLNDYRSVDSKFINTNPSSCYQYTFYSLMSLSLISTLLFFILAFLGFRDNNKTLKKLAPAIVMTHSLLFISIYSTISIE